MVQFGVETIQASQRAARFTVSSQVVRCPFKDDHHRALAAQSRPSRRPLIGDEPDTRPGQRAERRPIWVSGGQLQTAIRSDLVCGRHGQADNVRHLSFLFAGRSQPGHVSLHPSRAARESQKGPHSHTVDASGHRTSGVRPPPRPTATLSMAPPGSLERPDSGEANRGRSAHVSKLLWSVCPRRWCATYPVTVDDIYPPELRRSVDLLLQRERTRARVIAQKRRGRGVRLGTGS